MKIQELAIVFLIIILPISIVLSEYTQVQIKTLKLQSEYDSKLTAATYDAIKAFQLNAKNESFSDFANLRAEHIGYSVNSFRNSIMSAFKLNGLSEENINNYIPALVYTLYDGFYIYSPFENTNYRFDDHGTPIDGNGEDKYGTKNYISYSCRYRRGTTDVVITYALDNFIKVEGMYNGSYISKSGYLIDDITVTGPEGSEIVTYNGIQIEPEMLREYLPIKDEYDVIPEGHLYIKWNGTKYYYISDDDPIIYIANGKISVQRSKGDTEWENWKLKILNNDFAKQYYIQAYKFTEWFRSTTLDDLTYGDAVDQEIDDAGNVILTNIWPGNDTRIFDNSVNIENELSNFNQHRLKVIRRKIEVNLAIAIANYNEYSNVDNIFQIPLIKDDEWDQITHNISLISFLQGLPIGGKIYNGYTIVTNSESKEVVMPDNIYILGQRTSDGTQEYYRIGDLGLARGIPNSGGVNVFVGPYSGSLLSYASAGRSNLDFEKITLSDDNQSIYFYPIRTYKASYSSIVMQDKVVQYDDIFEYMDSQKTINPELVQAFYTALGRERAGKYNANINIEI